jgi:DNA-binding NarL/FixJ family response regulator
MSIGSSSIRVMTVDDHPLFRQGIATLIDADDDIELVAEASDGEEAIAKFRLHRPDVILMDIQMPNMNGIESISRIRQEFPDAKILVLSTSAGDVQILRAIKGGARGYLLKGNVRTELLEAIRTVHAGRKRIPPEIAAELAEHAADDQLSSREIDVLRLIGAGNANKQIADKLSIGETTVKNHISNILSKLGANDRAHAVTIALQRGIIELDTPKTSSERRYA